MFIKKIVLQGFKSFADKTVIEFLDGINIILGPNGCGKSNIIDAVRWVLGEQKIKTLRGDRSEDVIFSGTEKRSPAGFAQVSFYINNDPKIVHSDYPELIISRKLFRSGESIYFINKQECRLKDIQNLFLDTGVGKGYYSIIQQGQIERILSTKPEERRIIFEEAAGIARSKLRLKEAEQNLLKTEENLSRLLDIVNEVKHQVDSLKVQADTAREYQKYKNFIVEADKKIYLSHYSVICNAIKNSEQKGKEFEKQLWELKQKAEEKKQEINNLLEQIKEQEQIGEELKKQSQRIEVEEHKTYEEIRLMRNEIERLKKSESHLVQKRKEIESKKSELEVLTQEYEEEESSIEEKIFSYEKDYEELSQQLLENEETIAYLTRKINGLKAENNDLNKQVNLFIQKQKESLQKLFSAIEEKKALIINALKEKNQMRERLHGELSKLEGFFKKWDFFLSSNDFTHIKEMLEDLKNLKQLSSHIQRDFQNFDKSLQNIVSFFENDAGNVFSEENEMEIQLLRNKIEMNLKEIGELEKRLEDQRKSREVILKIQSDKNIEINKLKEKKLHLLSEKNRIEKEKKMLLVELSRIYEEGEMLRAEKEEREYEIDQLVASYESLKEQKEKIAQEKQNSERMIMEKTKKLKEVEGLEKKAQDEVEKLSRQMDKMVLEYKENLIRKDMLERSFFDKYSLNIALLPPIEEKIDEKKLQEEIKSAKEKLETIGPVNLLAIDQYEEENKRYQFLLKNKEDLEKAKKDLSDLIEEVNRQATDDFNRVFEEIKNNFQVLFKQAFGGGKAELRLTEPDKPLESDIEIIVQPPGKKLQNIFLLSGGEKTMTAISIIFAVFMAKPSPFCLLDEVDAALDETNVERLIQIINQFSHKTQFVIITHNRLTAKRGDVFYGITMQEAGVSKVFSFKPENLIQKN